jgi:lysophospholipase L1-like esterase
MSEFVPNGYFVDKAGTKVEIYDASARTLAAANALEITEDRKKIAAITEEKVNKNGVNEVTKDNADFITKLPSTNLFNEATMATVKSWFTWKTTGVSGEGKEVALVGNANTQGYTAIEVPITKAGDITIQMPGGVKIFAYFFVDDANIATAAWKSAIMADIVDGYTMTAPDGAAKLLLSLNMYEKQYNAGNKLMINYGVSAEPWEEYGERYVFDGVDYNDPRTEAVVSVIGEEQNTVKIMLPEKYALVVGDTFELFYKGIIKAVNPDLFDVRIKCDKGNAYTKRFIWAPTAADIGSHALTVELYGINHNLISTKTVQLVVKNKATSPAAPVNVLCIGDSLTTGGVWPAEVYRRLTAAGGTPAGDGLTNINFIGTRKVGEVGFEGYGGWKYESYLTAQIDTNRRIITCAHDKVEAVDQHSIYKDSSNEQWKIETVYDGRLLIIAVTGEGANIPASGTLTWVSGGVNHSDIVYTAIENAPGNPFWNIAENKVDIAAYAESLGVSSIDYVYILLGWNEAYTSEATFKAQANNLAAFFEGYNPNVEVVYMGLQIPARDGLGANYGARETNAYTYYYGMMQHVFNLDKWYAEVASLATSGRSTINIAGQFDTEHNSITATRTVNARNSETETYQSNGVHPAKAGYMQIADAVYRDLTHKLQS